MLQADIEKLFDEKPDSYTEEHFRLFEAFKAALNAGEVARRRARPVRQERLARERAG